MPLTAEQRQEIVTDLTTNCDGWKSDGDAETLNALPDDKLVALGRQNTIAKMAMKGFRDPTGNSFRLNVTTGQWEGKKQAPAPASKKKAPVANAPKYGPGADEDEEDEEDMDEDEMEKENKKRMFGKKKSGTQNAFRKPRTPQEWYDAAPAEVQATVNAAKQWEESERNKLATRLAANVAEEERPQRLDWLRTQPLEVLQNMTSMLPAPARDTRHGSAGTRIASPTLTGVVEEDDEVLGLPTINWSDPDADLYGRSKASQAESRSQRVAAEYEDEEETLAALPASVRNRLAEADRLVAREREGLIEQLTANMDEEEAEAFARKWTNRPLADLRDIAKIAPKRGGQQGNVYFGGGGGSPLGNARAGGGLFSPSGGDDTEVLPLPTTNWEAEDDGAKSQRKKQA